MHSPRRFGFTSHAVVLAVGLSGGLLLLDQRRLGLPVDAPPPQEPASHAQVAGAWLEQALAKAREEREKSDHCMDWEKLPIPELLKRNRREVDEQRAEIDPRLDAIISASSRYRDQADPEAAMRATLRTLTDEATDTALAMLHAWLVRDPEAALAGLGRNWRLLDDWYMLPALLEREFGRAWLAQQLGDEGVPYRMRHAIAHGLGTYLAWDAGLAGFLSSYQAVTDPVLRDRLWSTFTQEWPLEEPREVARILTNECPPALRNKLLDLWAPPQGDVFQQGSFPASYRVSVEWFKQVRDTLEPAMVPEAIRDNKCQPWWLERLEKTKPEPASLDASIAALLTDGQSKAKAIVQAMTRLVAQALEQNPGLAEPYVTGEATRQALLDQLRRDIPGADAYPQALEQAAWRATAARSEPRQLMAWAAALSKQEGFTDAFLEAVAPSYRNLDPRYTHVLDRYQVIVAAVTEPETATKIRNIQQNAWRNWRDLAPRPALAWREALPPDDPLRGQLPDPKPLDWQPPR